MLRLRGPLGWHHGPGVFGWLLFALFLVLVVLAVVAVVRLWRRPGGPYAWQGPTAGHVDPAITELRVRYARGEISRDEYLQRSFDLGAPMGTAPAAPPYAAPPGRAGGPTPPTPPAGGPPGGPGG